jgi:hypothetical protein
MSRLSILISILEPLLINDQNLDRAIESRIMELLLSMFYVPEDVKIYSKSGGHLDDPESIKNRLPLYLKYSLRCITSCVRSPVGTMDFANYPTSIP